MKRLPTSPIPHETSPNLPNPPTLLSIDLGLTAQTTRRVHTSQAYICIIFRAWPCVVAEVAVGSAVRRVLFLIREYKRKFIADRKVALRAYDDARMRAREREVAQT